MMVRVLVLQAMRLFADGAELLAWAQTVGEVTAMPVSMRRLRPATWTMKNSSRLEADCAEIGAFKQGNVFVLRELEDTLVEFQPAELAVEEPVGRQRLFALPASALVVCLFQRCAQLLAADVLRVRRTQRNSYSRHLSSCVETWKI